MLSVPVTPSRPRTGNRLRSSGGFTLVEVVCASFVLVFGMVSAMAAMQAGYRSLDFARSLTLTSQVLQTEIEMVRMMAWGEIAKLEPDKPDEEPQAPLQGAWSDDFKRILPRDFTLTRAISDTVVDSTVEMRQITVTATWKTVDGMIHIRSTSTTYCRNGLNDYYVTNPSSS